MSKPKRSSHIPPCSSLRGFSSKPTPSLPPVHLPSSLSGLPCPLHSICSIHPPVCGNAALGGSPNRPGHSPSPTRADPPPGQNDNPNRLPKAPLTYAAPCPESRLSLGMRSSLPPGTAAWGSAVRAVVVGSPCFSSVRSSLRRRRRKRRRCFVMAKDGLLRLYRCRSCGLRLPVLRPHGPARRCSPGWVAPVGHGATHPRLLLLCRRCRASPGPPLGASFGGPLLCPAPVRGAFLSGHPCPSFSQRRCGCLPSWSARVPHRRCPAPWVRAWLRLRRSRGKTGSAPSRTRPGLLFAGLFFGRSTPSYLSRIA